MLTAYQQQVQRLLNDEAAQFYNLADLTQFINDGRNDVARQSGVLIATGGLNTVAGQNQYPVASITSSPGYNTPISVRSISQVVAGISTVLEKRPWQWATNYWFNGANSGLTSATITGWTQKTQGFSGNLFLYPIPNAVLSLNCEGVWFPSALQTDTDPEVIPEPWATCVPYFACYEAYQQAQRTQDADRMMTQYQGLLQAARLGVTPAWARDTFPGLKTISGQIQQGKPTEGGVN